MVSDSTTARERFTDEEYGICPECDAREVTLTPGALPVCLACDWTGWEPNALDW